jgi:hypothetical protein
MVLPLRALRTQTTWKESPCPLQITLAMDTTYVQRGKQRSSPLNGGPPSTPWDARASEGQVSIQVLMDEASIHAIEQQAMKAAR